MEFLSKTPLGVNSNTGLEKFKAPPRYLKSRSLQALEKRYLIASAEQAARMHEYDKLENQLDEKAREIIDHGDSLRDMRRALLIGGKL